MIDHQVTLVSGTVSRRDENCIEIVTRTPLYPDEDGDRSEELEEVYNRIAIGTFGPGDHELDERDEFTMWIWKEGTL